MFDKRQRPQLRLWIIVCAITVAIALVTGCAGPAQQAAAPAQEPAVEQPRAEPAGEKTASEGGGEKIFTFGRYIDAITPDPVMNDANADIWYMQQYYSGLLRFNNNMEVEGDLAESWEISDDGLTYTFNLRPNLKFADGSPVKPSDWLWSLNRARNPENGIWWFTLEQVDTIEATESQVVFKLKEPYVPFIYSLALFNAVVMPADLVEAAGGWEKFMQHPIGTGPYIMKEWVKGDRMILERNPYYWEVGKPIVDKIIIKTIPDDNTRILALQKGDVQAINYPPFNRVPELEADPNINVELFPSTYTRYVIMNNRVEPFNDVRVRKALAYAINRDAMIKTINFGIGEPATTFRPRGSLYYNDSLEGWPYNPELAKQLLKEAGYPDGFKTEWIISTGDETSRQIATMIKDMWAAIGVDVEIQQVEKGLRSDKYYNNDFYVLNSGWTDDIPDPSQHTNYAMVYKTSESYHTGFQSTEAEELAANALSEMDPEARKQMYWRIQEIFNENTPFIPLYHEPYLVAVRKEVSNFFQTPLGTYVWRDLDITE